MAVSHWRCVMATFMGPALIVTSLLGHRSSSTHFWLHQTTPISDAGWGQTFSKPCDSVVDRTFGNTQTSPLLLNLIYTCLDLLLSSLLKPYLTEKGYGVSEISLTNSTDIARLAALLTACPNSITLDEEKKSEWNFTIQSSTSPFLWLKLVWIWPGSCRAWPRPCVWQTHVHRCQRTAKQYR